MTKNNDNLEEIKTDGKPSVPSGLENQESKDIIEYLFANGNRLLTATGAAFELPRDTQGLLAYFTAMPAILRISEPHEERVKNNTTDFTNRFAGCADCAFRHFKNVRQRISLPIDSTCLQATA